MKKEEHPQCYIVAGPNGAGKTTFALKYLPKVADCHDFINTDEIAKGLSPLDFEAGLLKAGKLFLGILDQKIAMRRDFAFETTLSGHTYLPKIIQWREAGWQVKLIYLFLPNPGFSKQRVQQRVLQGGHNVPRDVIERRYPKSLRNLFEYAEVCDHVFCFDNRGNLPVPIFEKRFGMPMEISDPERYDILQGVLKHD